MPYSPVPVPPGVTSDSIMLDRGIAPPKAVNESCEEFTAPVDVPVVLTANSAARGDPEPDLLALHVGSGRDGSHLGVGLGLEVPSGDREADPQRRHDGREHVALLPILHELAEGAGERERDHEQQEDLDQVGERARVLERMRGVGVEESAAVGPELLDALLRRDRASGDRLGLARDRGHGLERVEVLDHALRHEHEREDERDRQEDPHGPADHVGPEVPDRVRSRSG